VGACPAGSKDDAAGGDGRDEGNFVDVTVPITVSLDNVGNDGVGGLDNFHDDIEDLTAGGTLDTGEVIGPEIPVALIGSAGPNVLTGGRGNDRLDGGGGADQLRGLLGIDVADYSSRTAVVNLSNDGVTNDGETGELDGIWPDVENLRGGSANDRLTGNAVANMLDGGLGTDTIIGGAGVDAVDYSTRAVPVTVTLNGVDDDGQTGENDDIAADVEGAIGGQSHDVLVGNTGAGFLNGLAGDDKLSDGGGADTLSAGDGSDEVDSADGAIDTVSCGAGADKFKSDANDVVATDCEPASVPPVDPPEPPAPPAPPNPPTPPTPPVDPGDTTAPSASVRLRKGQDLGDLRSAGLKLTVRVGEAARVTGALTAEKGTRGVLKRRGIPVRATLGSGRGDLARAGSKLLTVKLTRQGRRALRGLGGARLKLVVTVTDRAGNKRTVTTHLRLS
jgi:Ca2+-binding RTX toxin-like protein